MNIRAEIDSLSKSDSPDTYLALLKVFTQKLNQQPELSDEDKLYIEESLIHYLKRELKNSGDEFPEDFKNGVTTCLAELVKLTHREVVRENIFDDNLNYDESKLRNILYSHDTQKIAWVLEELVEKLSRLQEIDEEQKSFITGSIIYPLMSELKRFDNLDLSEEQLAGRHDLLSALSNLIRLTHNNTELCTYIAAQIKIQRNPDEDLPQNSRDIQASFPNLCGFFYEILSEPRKIEEGETEEEYWDRYTYLISLHDIGFHREMLTWRLLTLAQAEKLLAEGKETDCLYAKSPLLFQQAEEDHTQMMKLEPLSCLRAEKRLWRNQLMGPLYNTQRLITIVTTTDFNTLKNDLPLLANMLNEHLTEVMMCSLRVPEVQSCAQALLKIYDGMLEYLQQQEQTQALAQELGNRLLDLLKNPDWPGKFSMMSYEIKRNAVTSYLEEHVAALSKRLANQHLDAATTVPRKT